MSTVLKTAAIGVGGLGALYYGQVGWQVYESRSEARRIQDQFQSETKAADVAEASVQREEKLLASLQGQIEQQKEALIGMDARIEAARQQVTQLERQHATLLKEASDAVAGIEQATGRLVSLAAEIKRRRENATLAKQALTAARSRSLETDALLNPLNHPLVKSFKSQ